MPELQILDRSNSPVIRYQVTYEDGRRSRTTRDCSVELAEAKRRKVSLTAVLAEGLETPDVRPVEEKVTVTSKGEVEAGEYILPEHEHPEYAESGHEHDVSEHRHDRLEDAYVALDLKLGDLASKLDGFMAEVREDLAEIRARVSTAERGAENAYRELSSFMNTVALNRERVDGEIEALRGATEALAARPWPEVSVTPEQLTEALAGLRSGLTALDSATAERLNLLSGRIDSLLKPEVPVTLTEAAVEAIVKRLLDAQPVSNLTVEELSRQGPDGHRRFVVQEVKRGRPRA